MKLYQLHASHNCYRVRLMLALLGLEAERIEMEPAGLSQPDFLALNPLGEVPVLADGATVLRDSHAILAYLARRYGAAHWLPDAAGDLARVLQWTSFAANEIQNGVRMARGICRFGRAGDLAEATAKARRALAHLDTRLSQRDWLETADPTIADVACYPYVCRAEEAGIDMAAYPALQRWFARIEALPGYVPPEADAPG
ncbi:MAG: glutathione S-transferase family protein [Rhodospirillaceae bacterium]|nr:glutathione S-transferase family protein [Rhodospirillaceae bacterium]